MVGRYAASREVSDVVGTAAGTTTHTVTTNRALKVMEDLATTTTSATATGVARLPGMGFQPVVHDQLQQQLAGDRQRTLDEHERRVKLLQLQHENTQRAQQQELQQMQMQQEELEQQQHQELLQQQKDVDDMHVDLEYPPESPGLPEPPAEALEGLAIGAEESVFSSSLDTTTPSREFLTLG